MAKKKKKKYNKFHDSPTAEGVAHANAVIELIKQTANNELLGVGKANRISRARKRTGDSYNEVYKTEGRLKHFKGMKKRGR